MISQVSGGSEYAATAAAGTQKTATAKSSGEEAAAQQSKYFQYSDSVEISEAARALSGSITHHTQVDNSFRTREMRDQQSDNYDSVLNELRQKYGNEEEAMTHFNAYMRSQGFDLQGNIDDITKQYYNYSKTPSGGTIGLITNWGFFNPKIASMKSQAGVPTYDFYSSNLFTYSSMVGNLEKDGSVTYHNSTWAVYNAYNFSNYPETADLWKNKNAASLSAQAGFDVKEYADNITSNKNNPFSAQSVSTDLGSMVSNILKQAGVTLDAGQEVFFSTRTDEHGKYPGVKATANFGDDALKKRIQNVFDQMATAGSTVLNAFVSQEKSSREYDLSSLPGQYDNGTQSVKFTQYRGFVYSGSQPSAVVFGSFLDAQTQGYTYQKRVSDEFSYDSDKFSVMARANQPGIYLNSPFHKQIAEIGVDMYKDFLAYQAR